MGWFSRVTHAIRHPVAAAESAAGAAVGEVDAAAHVAARQLAPVRRGVYHNIHRATAPVGHAVTSFVPARIRKPVGAAAHAIVKPVGSFSAALGVAHSVSTHLVTPADVGHFGGQPAIDARKAVRGPQRKQRGAAAAGRSGALRPQISPEAIAAANGVLGGLNGTLQMAAMLPIVAGGAGLLLVVYLLSRN